MPLPNTTAASLLPWQYTITLPLTLQACAAVWTEVWTVQDTDCLSFYRPFAHPPHAFAPCIRPCCNARMPLKAMSLNRLHAIKIWKAVV